MSAGKAEEGFGQGFGVALALDGVEVPCNSQSLNIDDAKGTTPEFVCHGID